MGVCEVCGGSGERLVILMRGRDGVTNEIHEVTGTVQCTACSGTGETEGWEHA